MSHTNSRPACTLARDGFRPVETIFYGGWRLHVTGSERMWGALRLVVSMGRMIKVKIRDD
jgi:hypothetical protein